MNRENEGAKANEREVVATCTNCGKEILVDDEYYCFTWSKLKLTRNDPMAAEMDLVGQVSEAYDLAPYCEECGKRVDFDNVSAPMKK